MTQLPGVCAARRSSHPPKLMQSRVRPTHAVILPSADPTARQLLALSAGFLFAIIPWISAPAARADENPIALIVAEYQAKCTKMQVQEVFPLIDEDLEPPTPFHPKVTLDPENVYLIDITPERRKATVLVADFLCDGFGSLGCGITGYCTSFIIVDDQVYELGSRGNPRSAQTGVETLIVVPMAGYMCRDSEGREGFGAAPCYQAIYWDDVANKFWSVDGSVKIRGDLSPP